MVGGYYKPTLNIYEEFDIKDERRAASILEYNDEFAIFGQTRRFYSTVDDESGFQINKWMEPFSYGSVDANGAGSSPYVNPNGD
ncbi:hypothetical protein EZS27_013743 [termite gut metagenome]|uniref:Uncharacterized protein n=1 Tax=termite gut metagenome TaxID=433724 RepID=A0A5J4RW89_9ZZZZ